MSQGIRLPDFDILVALYQHDPEAFEEFRRHLLRQAVNHAPKEHRPSLEKLLVRIEEERARAETPMDALRSANRMLQESMEQLMDGWEQACNAAAGLQTALLIEKVRY